MTTPTPPRTTLVLDPFADRERTQQIWTELAAVTSPPPPYFLQWAWIENWLVTLPPSTALKLVVLTEGDVAVAAWFLGERLAMHGGVIPVRTRFFNTTGDPEFDELTIEHNRWLARPGANITIGDIVAALGDGWDELALPLLAGDPTSVEPPWPTRFTQVARVSSHFVDLAKVRAAKGGDYLELLAKDCRAQIRRSERLYAERGPIVVEVASDLTQARAIFDELVELHRACWARRGGTGAFTPYMLRFHTRLIDERFASGEIQLIRVRAGDHTIGCLYNFVRDRDVAFYQCGFAYEQDNRLKPGLVCHARAIRYCADAGLHLYDFLAGEARYKRSLATDATTLVSCTVLYPSLRSALETRARDLLGRWRAYRAAA